jgi:hypothetical protein
MTNRSFKTTEIKIFLLRIRIHSTAWNIISLHGQTLGYRYPYPHEFLSSNLRNLRFYHKIRIFIFIFMKKDLSCRKRATVCANKTCKKCTAKPCGTCPNCLNPKYKNKCCKRYTFRFYFSILLLTYDLFFLPPRLVFIVYDEVTGKHVGISLVVLSRNLLRHSSKNLPYRTLLHSQKFLLGL